MKGADSRPAAGAAALGDCAKLMLQSPEWSSAGGIHWGYPPTPSPNSALHAQINTQCKCTHGFASLPANTIMVFYKTGAKVL